MSGLTRILPHQLQLLLQAAPELLVLAHRPRAVVPVEVVVLDVAAVAARQVVPRVAGLPVPVEVVQDEELQQVQPEPRPQLLAELLRYLQPQITPRQMLPHRPLPDEGVPTAEAAVAVVAVSFVRARRRFSNS